MCSIFKCTCARKHVTPLAPKKISAAKRPSEIYNRWKQRSPFAATFVVVPPHPYSSLSMQACDILWLSNPCEAVIFNRDCRSALLQFNDVPAGVPEIRGMSAARGGWISFQVHQPKNNKETLVAQELDKWFSAGCDPPYPCEKRFRTF